MGLLTFINPNDVYSLISIKWISSSLMITMRRISPSQPHLRGAVRTNGSAPAPHRISQGPCWTAMRSTEPRCSSVWNPGRGSLGTRWSLRLICIFMWSVCLNVCIIYTCVCVRALRCNNRGWDVIARGVYIYIYKKIYIYIYIDTYKYVYLV